MPAADPACVRSGSNDKNEYRPRNPEDSLLYRTIAGHLETFLARQQERGREVPQFIEREMRAYLSCGVLACGFLRLKCESCGKERLLPLSCKGRSVCPSCCGRRMADTAAHLVDRGFAHVPALLTRRGAGTLAPDEGESDRLARDQPWLSDVYAASVSGRIATGPEAGRRVAVGGDCVDPEGIDSSASPRCAAVAGFSLHGNVAIAARDRLRLERLFRYAGRPPLSMDRLDALPDGVLRYWFKTAWRN